MKIIITGALGHIGSFLFRKFIKEKFISKIFIIDNIQSHRYCSLFSIPKNNKIRTDFDHRIAMSFAVMGSKIGKLIIEDAESINTSFPNFIEKFNNAGGNIL